MKVTVLLLLTAAAYGQTLERAEALRRAHDFTGARDMLTTLVKQHPEKAEYQVRLGRLYLERFNPKDAAQDFQAVLTHDPKNAGALLGMALIAAQSYDASASDLAHKALASDPRLTEAQELLARLALEDNDSKLAREQADLALKLDAHSIEGEAVHASADLLEHEPADAWLQRMASEHPQDGRGDETVGYFMQLNRRYEDAIAWFRKGIVAEPDLWSAHSQLGLNLMRLGKEEEARKELELCFANHWRDDATVNTLRLMDTYKDFVTFKTGTTILRVQKKEADALRLYMEPELERAIATYQKKYEFKLPRQVQLEVYPNHEDFAVRTMGMPGLGALGVTFQDVVAMDSPSGRTPGEFHWAATMWHELSHVYVLTITKQRVPRWFTEGLAVHEETQASPDWGDRLTPDVVAAIKANKMLPVAEMDRGFIHPKYPGQVIVSYYQAGQICDFIAKQWGEHKLLDMVHAFAQTDSTPEVIEKQLGLKPEQFDEKFLAFLNTENKHVVDSFDQWQKQMQALHADAKAHNYDKVIAEGPAVRDLYPEFVESGNVYELLAQAYRAKGNETAAVAELERYSKQGGRNPRSLKDLVAMLSGHAVVGPDGNAGTITIGNTADARAKAAESVKVLERLTYIVPLDPDLHTMLGERYLAVNNANGAIREYRALIAEDAQDRAAAHYGLARALRLAHRDAEAKDELLESLEAAPGFKPAQKLLLEMQGNPSSD